jgi:hypothetical protein
MEIKITKEYLDSLNKKMTFLQIEAHLSENFGFIFSINSYNAIKLFKEFGIIKHKVLHNLKITENMKNDIIKTIEESSDKALGVVYNELSKRFNVSKDTIRRTYITHCGLDKLQKRNSNENDNKFSKRIFNKNDDKNDDENDDDKNVFLDNSTFFNKLSSVKKRIGFIPELPEKNQCKNYDDEYNLCKERIERGSYCKKHAEQNYAGVKERVSMPLQMQYHTISIAQLIQKEIKNNDFADIGKVL